MEGARMSDDSRVEVLPVPEGSIVWLHNIDGAPPNEDDLGGDGMTADLMDGLRRATGHNQFVVLCTNGDGVVEVLGPDELVTRVRAALDAPEDA
jgi:hypothetical protein